MTPSDNSPTPLTKSPGGGQGTSATYNIPLVGGLNTVAWSTSLPEKLPTEDCSIHTSRAPGFKDFHVDPESPIALLCKGVTHDKLLNLTD